MPAPNSTDFVIWLTISDSMAGEGPSLNDALIQNTGDFIIQNDSSLILLLP